MDALIYWGGWDGHTPRETAAVLAAGLSDQGFDVTVADRLDVLDDAARLASFDLIVPNWTMASPEDMTPARVANLSAAVRAGTGLAGVHGGMADSVRHSLDYQWMVGGQFAGHPHVGDYAVRNLSPEHPVMAGLPRAFAYRSEQYYLLVDPDIHVLAAADYCWNDDLVEMPVAWTREWGLGRVFYSALGHVAKEFDDYPVALALTLSGMRWAARGGDEDGDGDGSHGEGCGCGSH